MFMNSTYTILSFLKNLLSRSCQNRSKAVHIVKVCKKTESKAGGLSISTIISADRLIRPFTTPRPAIKFLQGLPLTKRLG